MMAADSSSLIAYFAGGSGPDVELIDLGLETKSLLLPPVVQSELLSDPSLPDKLQCELIMLELLVISPGYWQRAGLNRAKLIEKNIKARLADTLIAQSCIDHDVALISRDSDFRHFADYCGLRLA